MSVTPDAIRKVSDELEANRQSRKSAWATLQRLRKFLEATGSRISIPEDRSFETEGDVIESGLKRTIAGRDAVMRSLIRAVYRFRDATLIAEKKDDFGSAFQNLYRELERAEDLVGPSRVSATGKLTITYAGKRLRKTSLKARRGAYVTTGGTQMRWGKDRRGHGYSAPGRTQIRRV